MSDIEMTSISLLHSQRRFFPQHQLSFNISDFEISSISLPHSHTGFFPQRRLSFNIAYPTTRNYFQQDHLIPNSPHTILAFILPMLLNFHELRYPGKGNSPFDTHPISMWIGIVCLLAYCFVYGIELMYSSRIQSPNFSRALHHSMLLFGSLSLASLVSIFFPDSVQPVIYMLYTLLCLGKLQHSQVTILWEGIHHKIVGNLFYAPQTQERSAKHWIWTNASMDRRNILPLTMKARLFVLSLKVDSHPPELCLVQN